MIDQKSNKMEKITITKRIAKNGRQNIIILPAILKDHLRPRTLVKVTIDILEMPPEAQGDISD